MVFDCKVRHWSAVSMVLLLGKIRQRSAVFLVFAWQVGQWSIVSIVFARQDKVVKRCIYNISQVGQWSVVSMVVAWQGKAMERIIYGICLAR